MLTLLDEPNPDGLLGSKGVGGPPLVYGLGAFFALQNAIASYAPQAALDFTAPLTRRNGSSACCTVPAMPEPSPELLVWRALLGELVAGRPAVLAVVVAHTGSSAGRCGFVMAVGRDGWLAGTIGGGRPESNAVARAVTMLREGAAKPAAHHADPPPGRGPAVRVGVRGRTGGGVGPAGRAGRRGAGGHGCRADQGRDGCLGGGCPGLGGRRRVAVRSGGRPVASGGGGRRRARRRCAGAGAGAAGLPGGRRRRAARGGCPAEGSGTRC